MLLLLLPWPSSTERMVLNGAENMMLMGTSPLGTEDVGGLAQSVTPANIVSRALKGALSHYSFEESSKCVLRGYESGLRGSRRRRFSHVCQLSETNFYTWESIFFHFRCLTKLIVCWVLNTSYVDTHGALKLLDRIG